MRLPFVIGVVLAIAAVGQLDAHEPETLPTAEPLPIQPVSATEVSSDDVQHLLNAAQHLDSAGLKEDAHRLRSLARERTHRDNVVARKEEELECLVSEIEQLRQLTGQPRIVLIRVAAIEFSRAALGDNAARLDVVLGRNVSPKMIDESESRQIIQATGIPGYAFNPTSAPGSHRAAIQSSASSGAARSSSSVVEGNPLAHPLVRQLQERGLIKILAEPTVLATGGHPVSFLSGGMIPVNSKSADGRIETQWIQFGIQLKARATVMAGRRVRVQTNFEIKDRAYVVDAAGEPVPHMVSRGINTETELRFGQTAVLGSLTSQQTSPCAGRDGVVERLVSLLASKPWGGAKGVVSPPGTDDLRELIVLIAAESADTDLPVSRPVELIPTEIEPDELRRLLSPAGVPDDVQYFPASPIPRKGTLR